MPVCSRKWRLEAARTHVQPPGPVLRPRADVRRRHEGLAQRPQPRVARQDDAAAAPARGPTSCSSSRASAPSRPFPVVLRRHVHGRQQQLAQQRRHLHHFAGPRVRARRARLDVGAARADPNIRTWCVTPARIQTARCGGTTQPPSSLSTSMTPVAPYAAAARAGARARPAGVRPDSRCRWRRARGQGVMQVDMGIAHAGVLPSARSGSHRLFGSWLKLEYYCLHFESRPGRAPLS